MTFRARFFATTLAALAMTPAAQAEVIPAAQMVRGMVMTPAQCAAIQTAVWVNVARQGYCIRYYISTAGGAGQTPVAFLQGDRLGVYDPKTRSFPKVDEDQDIDIKNLQGMADRLSKLAGTVAIYVGRPGVEGSSGFHGFRRTWLELYVVQAALDAIKLKHGYRGFHLVGQSGGAGLIGGLLMLRSDIGCAVPGAGRLARLSNGAQSEQDRMLHYFDPIREVGRIAGLRGTRIIVITDPEDQRVKVAHQTTFVAALLQAGGRVEQYYVVATDDNRHGVVAYAFRAVAGCIKGEPQQQIEFALTVLRQIKLVDAAREKHEKARRATRAAAPRA